MENQKSPRESYTGWLIAIIIGAAIPILFLFFFNLAGNAWGHGSGDDMGPKNILFLAMLISIPVHWLSDVTGITSPLLNPYVVYGLFGALISLGSYALWKSFPKN